MATPLSPTDFNHQRLLLQWYDASQLLDKLDAWLTEHGSWPDDQMFRAGYWDKRRAFEAEIGLPDFYAPGRIQQVGPHRAWTLKLKALVRDDNDQPLLGDRVVQCIHCDGPFATFDRHEWCCSDACFQQHQSQKVEAKAKRRQAKSAERSKALANRSGICLACGETFNLKRITAKTCSEACRKRLQRHPELMEQHMQLPALRPDHKALEAELVRLQRARLQEVLASAAAANTATVAGTGSRNAVQDLEDVLAPARVAARLQVAAQHAPSLAAWVARQPEPYQLKVVQGWGEDALQVWGREIRELLEFDC
jgi:hypothetical protein